MYHCGAGDKSLKEAGLSVLAGATERRRRFCYQPFGIWNENEKRSADADMEGEWTGGC